MKLINGYVKIIENDIVQEKECKIISFFSWSNGSNTFPVALVMMENGEVHQCLATGVRFKLDQELPHTLQ